MKEAIKTLSMLIAFFVMLACVYLEVDIKVLVIRTLLTLVASYTLGMGAYWLSSIMMGKQESQESDEKSIEHSQAQA